MSSTTPTPLIEASCLDDLGAGALLAEAGETESVLREAEVHRLRIAYQWAITHPALDACETPAGAVLPGVLCTPETLGGPGTPTVAAFTPEPLAVALSCSPESATALIADALDLHHRLPLLWDQTQALLVPVWKARRVATATRHLSPDAARWVDRHSAGRVCGLGAAAQDRLIAEAAARCEPDDLTECTADARADWDVVLSHPDPDQFSGTSHLHAIGDTLDLTRFHDIVCAEAEALAVLGDTDQLGARKAKALGVIADTQARLDLTSLIEPNSTADPADPIREEARRDAYRRRDAKVRLYLHASLADIFTTSTGDDTGTEAIDTAAMCTEAVGTAESLGPVTLQRIRDWAGRARVTIQPVLHVAADDTWSLDRHDPPPPHGRTGPTSRPHLHLPLVHTSGQTVRPRPHPTLDRPQHRTTRHRPTRPDQPRPARPPVPTTPPSQNQRHLDLHPQSPGTYLWTGPAASTALVTPHGTITLPSN